MIGKAVKSSNLKSVGYDPASKILEVEFQNGQVHQYVGVGSGHHQNLLKSRSPGGYFAQNIRYAHPSTQVGS